MCSLIAMPRNYSHLSLANHSDASPCFALKALAVFSCSLCYLLHNFPLFVLCVLLLASWLNRAQQTSQDALILANLLQTISSSPIPRLSFEKGSNSSKIAGRGQPANIPRRSEYLTLRVSRSSLAWCPWTKTLWHRKEYSWFACDLE